MAVVRAQGDVLVIPGQQNPSHLIQVPQSLPDYRPNPRPLANASEVHGPRDFRGYLTDEDNVTHAVIAHSKLDSLGVNTGRTT